MRHLFFMGSLKAGGAERTLSRLSAYLCEEGDEVHIVLRKNIVQFNLHPKVKIHFVGKLRSTSSLGKIRSLRRRLRSIIRTVRPDSVCALTGLSGVILASTGTPNTTVRFSTYPRKLRYWKQSLFYSYFNLPNVNNIVCLTSDMRHDLRHLLSPRRLVVIHNAALPPDPAALSDAEASQGRPMRPYIVSLGRLSFAKAYDVALRAYAKAEAYRKYDYVLIGDGVAEKALKKLAAKLGITNYVHFVGYRSNPYPLVAGADIFLHTSIREGFPNVLVEALSLGVPIVSTNCKTGPSEIIENGVNGYLVPVNDVEAVAERLSFLMHNETVRQELSRNAPQSIERFEEGYIFARWRQVLGLRSTALLV